MMVFGIWILTAGATETQDARSLVPLAPNSLQLRRDTGSSWHPASYDCPPGSMQCSFPPKWLNGFLAAGDRRALTWTRAAAELQVAAAPGPSRHLAAVCACFRGVGHILPGTIQSKWSELLAKCRVGWLHLAEVLGLLRRPCCSLPSGSI